MREAVFIKQNIRKWREYEYLMTMVESQSPDELADMYNDLTADLAFAQTHYPNSRITLYLNNLTLQLHTSIYGNKREKWSRISRFWTHEVPLAVWDARKELLLSLSVFLLFIAIGVVSSLNDYDFPRLILGDGYVDMTIDNIRHGDPAAVYQGGGNTESFLMIAFNNIRVSLMAFALGVLTSLGSIYYLMMNGVMVGAFTTMFYNEGVLGEAMLAIMLHGTLELSTIVIEGGAGIVMGNGWLFPGTYSRIQSFRRAAKRGLKIVVGTLPVVIAAAVVEGYFTRYTHASNALRGGFIILSAAFIIYYYVILPYRRAHETQQ
ncbi:MAG: stage II sporulation protein M [Muribaculaceae bacterium]|nr:stage II sporulation protein M [Muribaculaceae bacterium]